MQLRPYQETAKANVLRDWLSGIRSTLLVLPTGSGKTIVFSRIIEDVVRLGGRVLVIAHRGELLQQAADKLCRTTGLRCAVEKAEETALDSWLNVVVGSVQTLQSRDRRNGHEFTHIIVDEAHHAITPSYRAILDHWPDARVLGVTATADRGDKRNLGEVFEHVAFEYHLPDAITDGYLAPIRALTIPLRIEVGHEGAGDITPEEASNALEPYLHQIADHIRAECVTRKTVCFLPLIDISRRFAGMLAERGITAREVNGESPDRAQVLRWFDAAGPGTVLCNAMLLTEGWDCISVDCICPLRPTKIRSLYAQMVGRGTRLAPGKRDLLLLDFLWQSRRLPLCRPAHLVCDEEPEVMARVAELLAERAVAGPVDIVTDGAGTALEERERALARILEEQRKRKRELVDPLQYERSIGVRCDDAGDLRPPTIDQKKALQAAGIYPDEITSRTHAAEILSALQLRQWQGAATPKQIRALERYGFQDVGRWPKSEAAKVFCILAKNRWALPNYLHPATYRPAKMVEGVAK